MKTTIVAVSVTLSALNTRLKRWLNYRRGGQCVLTLQDRDRLRRRLEAWAETTRRYVIDRIMGSLETVGISVLAGS